MYWVIAPLFLVFILFIICYVAFRVTAAREKHMDRVEQKYYERLKKTGKLDDIEKIQINKEYIKSLKYEDVYIQSFDDLKLHSKYYKGSENVTVILCHGYKSFGEFDFCLAMPYYIKKGFSILLIDERAHGLSEGRYITFGAKEYDDVIKWREYVSKKAPGNKIVLHGVSMGATAVLLSEEKNRSGNISCLVADCGYTDVYSQLRHVLSRSCPYIAGLLMFFVGIVSRLVAGFSLKGFNTVSSVKSIHVPTLFIHGTADKFVPTDNSEKNFAAANEPKELLLIYGAHHGQSFLVDEQKCTAGIDKLLTYI